jgi:hypothetical protein
LTVTAPTTEGDPISTSYAAGADGRIELIIDDSRDKFGGANRGVTRRIRVGSFLEGSRPRLMLSFTDCSSPTPYEE